MFATSLNGELYADVFCLFFLFFFFFWGGGGYIQNKFVGMVDGLVISCFHMWETHLFAN